MAKPLTSLPDETPLLVPSKTAKAFAQARWPNRKIVLQDWPTHPLTLPPISGLKEIACRRSVAPSPASLRVMRRLADRLLRQDPSKPIVIAGATCDDDRLMSYANVFITGAVAADEIGDVLAPHNPGWLLTDFEKPVFGHPLIETARQASIPVAYRDWSAGSAKARKGDLAIPADVDERRTCRCRRRVDRTVLSMARVIRARTKPTAKPKLVSRLALAHDGTVSGFVFDPEAPERRFTVEILLDGLVLRTTYADAFVPELSQQGQNSTCGFAVTVEPDLLRAAGLLEARLANLGTPVGHPIDLENESADPVDLRPTCKLRWLGGLHFQGWIDSDAVVTLEAIVDGEICRAGPRHGLDAYRWRAPTGRHHAMPVPLISTSRNALPTDVSIESSCAKRTASKFRQRRSSLHFPMALPE